MAATATVAGRRRHTAAQRGDVLQRISTPVIRRLARRGGIKRMSSQVNQDARAVLRVFLDSVIRDAVTYTQHEHHKTITALSVVRALGRQGRIMYGYGN